MQCTATSKRTGKQCKRNARVGLKVCPNHGGNSPASRAKSERAKQQRKIRYKAGQLGRLLEDAQVDERNPIAGILDAVRRAGALMRVFGNLVGELDVKLAFEQRDLPDGSQVSYPASLLGYDHLSDQTIHVLMKEYRDSVERYAKVCKIALDAGVAVAQVRIEREKIQAVAFAMQAVLRDLQLTPEQRAVAPALLRKHILALPADGLTGDQVGILETDADITRTGA